MVYWSVSGGDTQAFDEEAATKPKASCGFALANLSARGVCAALTAQGCAELERSIAVGGQGPLAYVSDRKAILPQHDIAGCRGAEPNGPDDGTIAPWAVVASLPFAPEIVLPAIDYCVHEVKLTAANPYGFKATFNPTHPDESSNPYGWISPWHYGLNQGPIILMIENYRTGLLWQLMRRCPYIVEGLRRAGFTGRWL